MNKLALLERVHAVHKRGCMQGTITGICKYNVEATLKVGGLGALVGLFVGPGVGTMSVGQSLAQ